MPTTDGVYAGQVKLRRPSAWCQRKAGDLLWLREAWAVDAAHDALPPRDLPARLAPIWYGWYRHVTVGGDPRKVWVDHRRHDFTDAQWRRGRPRAAFHMPRAFSRITLRVRQVRQEPLQAITWADAIAEGIRGHGSGYYTAGDGFVARRDPRLAYFDLWDKLNPSLPAASSPQVAVIEFEPLLGNILATASWQPLHQAA